MLANPLAGPRASTHPFKFPGLGTVCLCHLIRHRHIQISFIQRVEDWVHYNRSALNAFANRPIPLPLGRRLQVSVRNTGIFVFLPATYTIQLSESSQFVSGMLRLLVDRNSPEADLVLENYVDVRRWAAEYFRTQHSSQKIDSDVPIVRMQIFELTDHAHLSDSFVAPHCNYEHLL